MPGSKHCASFLMLAFLCVSLSSNCHASSSTPTGWVETQAPGDNREAHYCANYSSGWVVSLNEQGDPKITPEKETQKATSPEAELPKNFQIQKEMRGRSSSIKINNGWLLGFDHGEWGGGLWFIRNDGQAIQLSKENIHGFLPTLGGAIVFAGLSHLLTNEGRAFIVFDEAKDKAKMGPSIQLDGSPEAFAWTNSSGEILVVTSNGVSIIDVHGSSHFVMQSYLGDLVPNSLVVAKDGAIYVGMRMYIVRLSKTPSGYKAQWLVQESCRHFKFQDYSCVCSK